MICLDANIILDAVLKRKKAKEAIDLIFSDQEICITFLSVHLVYYFCLREKIPMEMIDDFLEKIPVLTCNQEVYNLAKKIRENSDFEDSLQVATAVYNQVETFYTLDADLAKKYGKLVNIKVI